MMIKINTYLPEHAAIGVDIGGSHITCGLMNLSPVTLVPGTIVNRKVNNQAGADEILERWVQALNDCLHGCATDQVTGVGFAMPGPFDYVQGIGLFKGRPKYHNLHEVDVAKRIRQLMHFGSNQAVRFMNDATAFAVGEAWTGKARGYSRTLVVTLGTGFGSAFLEDSIPVVEGKFVPPTGSLWHLPFMEGMADDYFSTRWIVRRYEEFTGVRMEGVKEITDQVKYTSEVASIFSEFGENLGTFLSEWIKKFGAEVLVIGGNISKAYTLFGGALKNALLNHGTHIQTEVSTLMERAAMIGSARLCDESFWQRVKPLLPHM